MIEPIVLNDIGETLKPFNDEVRDEDKLYDAIGWHWHGIYSGQLSICDVTVSHQAIFCSTCNFRIIVPASIKIYADLRERGEAITERSRVYPL